MNLTTLGWLKHLRDPCFQYFEYHYLKVLYKFLTKDWGLLQKGTDEAALEKWVQVMAVLELDRKATTDLVLLAQSGVVGRTHASKLLWHLMTVDALDGTYEDLSHKVTNMVGLARRDFDRPPREHMDLQWWWWTCYEKPYSRDRRWLPSSVPAEYTVLYGEGLEPLKPPDCWGPVGRGLGGGFQ